MQQYRTKDDDMLDQICLKFYGHTNQRIVEQVIEANPMLANQGVILKTGIIINLPNIEMVKSETQSLKLWD